MSAFPSAGPDVGTTESFQVGHAVHPLRLAVAAPVFAAAGHPGMRTPSLAEASWTVVREAVARAEALGYDAVWFSDHLFHGRGGAFHESWTALSMAAGFTDRIHLVNNHLGIGIRDPRVIAKMATTLADATGDRFELFLATGYRERELRAYGLGWDDDATRWKRLRKALDVVRALWSGEMIDADGEFYPLHGAVAAPTGSTAPFVWVGGPIGDEMLALVAEEADGWNTFPLSVDDFALASARVDDACRRIGRSPSSLRRSLEIQVLVLDDEADWDDWVRRWERLRSEAPLDDATSDLVPAGSVVDDAALAAVRDTALIGTPAQIAQRIAAYRAAGMTDLVCWFMDIPSHRSMESLREIVESSSESLAHEREEHA